MFIQNDDLSIYATRGDIVFFSVSADSDGELYAFKAGAVVRIKIFGKKDAETVVLEKDFPVTEDTQEVEIFLTKEDTKIGEIISKPKDYWYEVELNPHTNPQTIIGYDEDGPKIFRLFPEGADAEVYEPTEEDIPFVDDELDLTSTRPVQNQAVARAVVKLNADYAKAEDQVNEINKKTTDLAATQSRFGVESEDYPGCYYRDVDGVQEWLNPPMEDRVPYRTAKRHKGKPVYAIQQVIADTLPTISDPVYTEYLNTGDGIKPTEYISFHAILKGTESHRTQCGTHFVNNSGSVICKVAIEATKTIEVRSYSDELPNYTLTVFAEYTLD